MSKQTRLSTVFTLVLGGFVAVSFASVWAPAVHAADNTADFKVTPVNYEVEISNSTPVLLNYKLTNNSDSALAFTLKSSQPLSYIADQTEVVAHFDGRSATLSKGETLVVEIAARSDSKLELDVRVLVAQDFSEKYSFVLSQTATARRLTQSDYPLNLSLTSKLASVRNEEQAIVAVGAVTILVLAVLVLAILIARKYRKQNS